MLITALFLCTPLLQQVSDIGHPSSESPTQAVSVLPRLSVSQFGITWKFKTGRVTGTFANGDWWVLGPVAVESITPGSKDVGGRVMNGSMVNPEAVSSAQGYDSAMYGKYSTPQTYLPSLNRGHGVSASNPLILEPGDSLISSISLPKAGARPQLRTAAILTVVNLIPAADAFRPPYAGVNKKIRFRVRDLQWKYLRNLAMVPKTPSLASIARTINRPWIDHVPNWAGRYVHPAENMPDYGREMADEVGNATLMMFLNFSQEEKEPILISLVQLGIDLYGVLQAGDGKNWQNGGGHHSGRKWPILFAGAMLHNLPMAGVGLDPTLLFMGEDGQTFYVEETSPGVYNYGFGGYGPQHVGMPEWGQKHALNPTIDDLDWFGDPYRTCCTGNSWTGQLLAVRIMGAMALWNHPALFDYQDRFVTTQKQNGGSVATSRFAIEMWNAYRTKF